MNIASYRNRSFALLCVAVFAEVDIARGQYQPYQQPRTYTDMYREQYQLTHAPPKTAANYTINKYYYHNLNISPYSNLLRPTTGYKPQYQAFVQPEVQRRARAQQAAGPRPTFQNYNSIPNLGGPAKTSQYHDHYYGGFLGGP
jgi:hypothetical protein